MYPSVEVGTVCCKHMHTYNHTQRVGVALTTAPALHGNDRVTLADDMELEGLGQTKLDTVVHIFLPLHWVVDLGQGVVEGVGSAVQVARAGGIHIARHWWLV